MELFTEYYNKRHLLSQIDVRIKIIIAVIALILVLSYKGFLFPLIIILLCSLLSRMMNVPGKVFIVRYLEPGFIALVLLVLKTFFTGSEPIFYINLYAFSLTGYKDGLIEGLILATRMIASVSIIITLGFGASFTDIMAGLSWFKIPKTLIEITMFAYRYIFVLLEDAIIIYNAQKNRLGYSNTVRGLNSFSTLVGSLIIKAYDNSQKTTISMIQRGYDGNIPFLKQKPFKPSEIIASILLLISLGVIWKI